MSEAGANSSQTLSVELDAETLADLQRVAGERDAAPGELVGRWVRERLAHERERAQGRAREQRPRER